MDNQETNIAAQKKDFINLFLSLEGVKITQWIDDDAVGLSILKDYPDKGLFIPARNQNGEKDSVSLIRIGYRRKEEKEGNKVPLIVSIRKASRYLLNNHWDFDFKDKESPTQSSLEESKASRQLIGLEETSRYEFRIDTKKFYDLGKKKFIKPSKIAQDIYDEHLKTLTNWLFRTKMALQKNTLNIIGPFNNLLHRINFWLFGRQIRETTSLGVGYFKTYSHKDLLDLTTEKIKIFGSDFPITNQTATTFSISILMIFLINYYFNIDVLGLVALIHKSGENSLFLATLTFVLLLFFDRLLPHIILLLINFLITLRLRLIKLKIST